MKIEPTIYANIYVGLKEGYEGTTYDSDVAYKLCQDYIDEVGLCVTFTKTEYIYTKGNESGLIIGLINYPRFPSDRESIKHHALALSKILLKELRQYRLSIVMDDYTYMLEAENDL
jgi:hypothetical protein